MRLILLFILLPLLEIFLLIQIGRIVGWPVTILLCIFTGALGAVLTRHSGLVVLQQIQLELGQGRVPKREILEGLLILVAGAVLLTPGVITDVVGFLILTPPARRVLAAWGLGRRFSARGSIHTAGFGPRDGSSPFGGDEPRVGRDGPGKTSGRAGRTERPGRTGRPFRADNVTDAEFEYRDEREDR